MRMNKKGVHTLSGIIIGLLLFMSVMIAVGKLMSGINDNYGTDLNNSFVTTYDKVYDVDAKTVDIKGQVGGSQADTTSGDWASKGILSAIKIPFFAIDMTGELTQEMFRTLQFGDWAVGIVFTIMTLIVVFVIIGLLTKVET